MNLRNWFWLIAILSIGLFLAWYFSNIVAYIIISLILATLLKPLTNYLSGVYFYGIHVPRPLSILISFLLLIVLISLFVLLFVPLVDEQIEVLTSLNFELVTSTLFQPIHGLENLLIRHNLTENPPGFLVDAIRESFTNLIRQIEVSTLVNSILSVTGNILVGIIAVIFITFFFLYEQGILRKFLLSMVPNKYFELGISTIHKIENLLSNYLLGLVLQLLAIFSIASLGLTIVGVKYALTIAIFAAVANLIPYLGPILGAIFGIVVAVTTGTALGGIDDYFFYILKIIIVFALVQLADNLVLQPLIFSKSVKAHPLEIFVIIFVGASLAGILGMILAIPAYTVLRVSFIEISNGIRQYQIFKQGK